MANQTVFATSDVQIDTGPNNEGIAGLNMKPDSPNESNMFFRFDVSSLSGKMWDSVVLLLTYDQSQTTFTSGPVYISRVLRDIVYTQVTSVIFKDANNWNVAFAENSIDNDHTTRVNTFDTLVQGLRAQDEQLTSADLTDLVRDGVIKDSGTLDVIMYPGSGAGGGNVMQVYALEAAGPATQDPQLLFTNVEDMEETTTSGTAAVNVAVPSASVLSQSGRPPIAGADRQVTGTILHDGVEPMTILSMTIKGTFGTDN